MTTTALLKTAAWSLLALIIFVTVSPINLRPHTLTTVSIDRAAAYAVVGVIFALAYPRSWKTIAVLLVLGAAGFEFLQLFQPSRHARIDDALVKASGALIGVTIGHVWNRTSERSRLPVTSGASKP
jgi:VanZ family protein